MMMQPPEKKSHPCQRSSVLSFQIPDSSFVSSRREPRPGQTIEGRATCMVHGSCLRSTMGVGGLIRRDLTGRRQIWISGKLTAVQTN